jgi:hypothetical protein
MTSPKLHSDFRPLALLGTALLGLGLALRILVPDEPVVSPLITAIPAALLLAGSGVVLLERFLRGGTPPSPWVWAILLAIAFGLFPSTGAGLAQGGDFLAAVLAGVALRDLVRHDGLGPALLRGLCGLAAILAVLGLAQTLYQRDELRTIVHERGLPGFESGEAEAFLASNRATGTLASANAYAGWLLLMIPLVVVLAGRSRAALVLAILLGGAFLAAGSAGAGLALLLATGVLVVGPWRGPWRWPRITAALGVLGVVALVFALTVSLPLPGLEGKVETFRLRIDYHRQGARMLPDMGLLGAGLEATSELRWDRGRPDEAQSAYLHDTWFQLLLELGPLGLAAMGLGAWGLLRSSRGPLVGVVGPRSLERALVTGLVLGAAVAPFVSRLATPFPLTLEMPLLDAAWNAGLLFVTGILLRDATRPLLPPYAFAVMGAAMLLHGCVDFALYAPAVATTAAALFALVPGRDADADRRTPDRSPRLGHAALLGMLCLLLPAWVGWTALVREEAQWAEREGVAQGHRTPQVRDSLLRAFDGPLPPADSDALRALSAGWSARDPAVVERVLDALSPTLRDRALYRRAEAEHIVRRALGEPASLPTAQRRAAALLRPPERLSPWILLASARLASQAGESQSARRLAAEGLHQATTWNIQDPILLEALREIAR